MKRCGSRSLAVVLVALTAPAWAQPAALSPAECRVLRERIGEHARVSVAARRALGIPAPASPPAPAAPTAPPSVEEPASRAEAIQARLAQLREERERLDNERVGAMVRLDFLRVAQIQERLEALEREERGLKAELAGVEQAPPPKRPAPPKAPPPAPRRPAGSLDLALAPCRDLPALEDKALRARRKELGAAEWQGALVPLLPVRGQTERDVAQELASQLGAGPEAAQRLGLLDQDGDAQLDGFVDSPGAGVYRLYRQRADGSVAIDLFVSGAASPDAPYGEAARRLEEALLRQTRRPLADLLLLHPVGPARVLGETQGFARLRALVGSAQFDQMLQAGGVGAQSAEFKNYRGETVRLLDVVGSGGGVVQVRSSSILVKADGEEQWEETVTRFRPVSYWRTEVEVDVTREVRSPAGGLARPRAAAPTVRFSLER